MFRRNGRSGAAGASRAGQSGQALLEFALIVPVLVLLVMAIFEFAYVIETQVGLTNAVREAARRTAATTTKAPTWSGSGSLTTWVQGQLCGDAVGTCDAGLLHSNVQGFDPARLWSDPPTVTFCSYPVVNSVGATVTNYRVKVAVRYGHPLFFGPMAFATDYIDGTPNGNWDLSASAELRMENVDATASGFADPGACP